MLLGICTITARADGLQDLKQALARLGAQTPVKASIEVKTWHRIGEGSDVEEHQGLVAASLEDNARGLQLSLGKETLAHVEAEKRAEAKDPKANTPTLYALKELDTADIYPLLSTANRLSRVFDEAVFKEEKVDTYGGKPARVLRFSYPIERMPERDRKYVKKFDCNLDVWIAADGTPLASRLSQDVSGRAFVVVTFAQKSEEEFTYAVVGDRLVTTRMVSHEHSEGAGDKVERRITRTLQLQS
ncbi:MAG: hypothetical protein JO142_09355 [Burkholderiales bacterium]|nr:hypothetical protein [Burkholderiales bacterium]